MEPFAHLVIENCLPADYYRALADAYPPDAQVLELDAWRRGGPVQPNQRNDIGAHQVLRAPGLVAPVWEAFVRHHASAAFWADVVRVFGPALRATYPDLEQRLGGRLEHLASGVRFDPDGDAGPISLDCQIGINTPVTHPGSVRVHTDAPEELFAMLLYFRRDEDDSTGGELEIRRWKPGRARRFVGSECDADDAELVATIPYRANTLVAFVNSDESLHAVSPRSPTPHSRRLVNLIGEVYRALPDGLFVKTQKWSVPWRRRWTRWKKRLGG
ncbi:2OG-Fe(II) oxygenase [Piscinibacter koreensis]|uniref:2OG-Fe(II) oxygenase n=1 Tax=Piscinibacter koreensis TaxID=2742824 RepID=A0A7Y6NM91_9BURK|nr:2OG-Fe(II) oxygenase [Schlegelella koreensis]NUZ05788.1 2OG-Fe(II) oxygenase [Schlegelella koreensis]